MPSIASRRGGNGLVSTSLLLSALLATLCLFLAGTAAAQTGAISGTVKDDSGMPVQGASVVVVGTGIGGITNAEGAFTIPKIPVGVYTVKVLMMGKEPQLKNGVEWTPTEPRRWASSA